MSAGQGATEHRAGFGAFVGRPNAGKSTLTNALVGDKIVITEQAADDPAGGPWHRAPAGLRSSSLLDTPGLHRPRTLLGAAQRRSARPWPRSMSSGSACPPTSASGRATGSSRRSSPRVPVANRRRYQDRPGQSRPQSRRRRSGSPTSSRTVGIGDCAEIVPVSATRGAGRPARRPPRGATARGPLSTRTSEHRRRRDPPSPNWSARRRSTACATNCRTRSRSRRRDGAASAGRRTVRSTRSSRPSLPRADSQKGIVIGAGDPPAKIGTRARAGIETLLGTPVPPRPARGRRQGLAA